MSNHESKAKVLFDLSLAAQALADVRRIAFAGGDPKESLAEVAKTAGRCISIVGNWRDIYQTCLDAEEKERNP